MYYIDDSTIAVLVVDFGQATGTSGNYAVINSTSAAINADGDEVVYVEGFKDGKVFAAYTDGTSDADMTLAFVTPTLYDLDLNSDGVITKATAVTTGITGNEALVTGTVGDKDGSALIRVGATNWYTIDSSVVVYQLNAGDGEYVLKTMSSVKTGAVVTMWQLDDNSEVYDLIIISAE